MLNKKPSLNYRGIRPPTLDERFFADFVLTGVSLCGQQYDSLAIADNGGSWVLHIDGEFYIMDAPKKGQHN